MKQQDLITLTKTPVNIQEVRPRLTGRLKKKFLEFLQTLEDRGILFSEDLEVIEGAFKILDQAEKTLRHIGKIERMVRECSPLDFVPLDSSLAKNRALYSRLMAQYHNITKDFFTTPSAKLKAVNSLKEKEREKGNPILDVLSGQDS